MTRDKHLQMGGCMKVTTLSYQCISRPPQKTYKSSNIIITSSQEQKQSAGKKILTLLTKALHNAPMLKRVTQELLRPLRMTRCVASERGQNKIEPLECKCNVHSKSSKARSRCSRSPISTVIQKNRERRAFCKC